jgi:hypothetical protein
MNGQGKGNKLSELFPCLASGVASCGLGDLGRSLVGVAMNIGKVRGGGGWARLERGPFRLSLFLVCLGSSSLCDLDNLNYSVKVHV